MEWYIMNSTGVRSLATGFGTRQPDGRYVLADECSESLSDMIDLLERDDPSSFLHRRHILAEDIIQRDLSQIISSGIPDAEELSLVFRLLSILASPVDLTSVRDDKIRKEVVRLSHSVHTRFLEIDFVTGLFNQLNELITESGEYEMQDEGYASISGALTLIYHVLEAADPHTLLRSAIIGLLLQKGLPALLIYSIRCHRSRDMAYSAVRILALLYSQFEWTDNVEESQDLYVQGQQYITDKLQCLIVRLLQGPLVSLVKDLQRCCHSASSGDAETDDDKRSQPDNLLNWSLAFFLPFLNKVSIPLDTIRDLLKSKVIGYLVYQAAKLSLKLFDQTPTDSLHGSCVQLVFSAIESIISLSDHYKSQPLERAEQQTLTQFHYTLYSMSELRDVILLHIRKWGPAQTRPFLYQLLLINHRLLSAIQSYIETGAVTDGQDVMLSHVNKFASREVVSNLSVVTESYSTNNTIINEATFNLLSHIAVDCQQVALLYHPQLLQSLNKVSDDKFATNEDQQFADFVIKSFRHNLTIWPELCMNAFIDSTLPNCHAPASSDTLDTDWSSDEESELGSASEAGLVSASEAGLLSGSKNVIGKLARRFLRKGERSIQKRLERMELNAPDTTGEGCQAEKLSRLEFLFSDIEESERGDLIWIHEALKGDAFIKASKKGNWCDHAPVHVFALKRSEDFPVLPFTESQEASLRSPSVMRLLSEMNLLSSDAGSGVPVIPVNWRASDAFKLAEIFSCVATAPFYATISPSTSMSSLEDEPMITTDPKSSLPFNPPSSCADSNSQLWAMYIQNRCKPTAS